MLRPEVAQFSLKLEYPLNLLWDLHYIGSMLEPDIITIREVFIWAVRFYMATSGLPISG